VEPHHRRLQRQVHDDPVDLGSPSATYKDPAAKIYPFKKMTGNQVADKNNKTMMVPHLYGAAAGPNAYWSKYDWVGSLTDAANYLPAYNAGAQVFTGEVEFVDTVMLLKVDHEVAPKEQAFGFATTAPTATSPARSTGRRWVGRRIRRMVAHRRCPD